MSDTEEKQTSENNAQTNETTEQPSEDLTVASPTGENPFEQLTPELVIRVLSFLDLPDLMNAQLVNHDWNVYARSDTLWKHFYESTEWYTHPPDFEGDHSWYDRFCLHYEEEIATIGGESYHEEEDEQDDQILTLPDPETLTVEELRQLLATEEFVMALQSGEDAVLVFLEAPATILVMMDLLFNGPHQADDIQSQRITHITVQTLVSGIITDVFIMNNDLLDALFDHLDTIDTSTEFGQTHSACIGKIVSILFEKFPTQLISYFQFRDTFIPSLLTHTKEPNLMEIIYKFVDSDLAHQWLLECDLVARLISLLHFEESLATQESAANVLVGILSLCQAYPHSVLVHDVLNNEVVTGSLIAFMEAKPIQGDSIKLQLRVLIGILSLISDELEDPPLVVTLLSQSVGLLVNVLVDQSDPSPPFRTTYGGETKCFGFVRLGVLELLVSLLYTGFPVAVEYMVEEKVFTVALDFLFEYPWNNIIHNQISQLFSGLFCCNNPDIIEAVMEDSRLAERIADAHQEAESQPAGYMGHLREIANELVRAGKLLDPIGAFLSTKPTWQQFVEVDLAEFNMIECVVQDDYLEYDNQEYLDEPYEEYEIVETDDAYDDQHEGEEPEEYEDNEEDDVDQE